MIRRGVWILAFAATAGVAADFAAAQSQPAPAKSQELYQNVYSGWKVWHVYCYRCHGTNAVGTTLRPARSDAIHCTAKRMKNIACATKPRTTHQLN